MHGQKNIKFVYSVISITDARLEVVMHDLQGHNQIYFEQVSEFTVLTLVL